MLEIRSHVLPSVTMNVTVTTVIKKDCQSAPFHVEDLFAEDSSAETELVPVNVFAKDDALECNLKNWSWIKLVCLAEDCQSYNLELRPHFQSHQSTDSPTFVLAAAKKIRPNENVVLWFSRDILTRLRVPHLSLSNIQDEKKYACHRCPFQCEMPNPLKIHLALECGSFAKEDLWRRLCQKQFEFDADASDAAALTPPLVGALALQPPTEACVATVSAFKPYQRPIRTPTPSLFVGHTSTMSNGRTTKLYSILHSAVIRLSSPALLPQASKPPPTTPSAQFLAAQAQHLPANDKRIAVGIVGVGGDDDGRLTIRSDSSVSDADEAAVAAEAAAATILYKRAIEMETIASNLGKFKRGHLCIYCGKMYSRKYGLKIHIRTHTGFKPLKCKFCSRPFGDPSNLNKHVRLHSVEEYGGAAPYKCEQCGKILVRKRDLDRHVKSRH